MALLQLDTENADRNLTALIAVLTHTPTVSGMCVGLIKLGDGTKNLSATGGVFQLVVTVGGQTVQPSPQYFTFSTAVRSMVWTLPFPVVANDEVIMKVLSPNAADADVDVTAYLYDTTAALPAAVFDGVGGLPISDAGGLDLDAILADTSDLQTNQGNWLTAITTVASNMRGTDGAITSLAGVATEANVTAVGNAVLAVPAAVWAVASRSLTTFGSLVADVAAAVWGYTVRTFTGVSGSISYAVLSGSVRDDYITAIGHLVGGELPLDEAEKIFAINAAIKKYSAHRPRIAVEDEDGNGSFDYLLALLADWTEGFSTIKSVEYPVDDTSEAAAILQDEAWQIYQKPTGKVLRFLEDTPAATEDIRVTYTTLHVCTDAACTIPPYDEEALQMLAASIFCDMLAAYFAQTQDSTIQADSVDHKSKASEYAARARAYRKMYFDHIGIKEGETPAASVTRDQDLGGSWGAGKMTHGRGTR